jgi:hypothetical protein
MKVIFDPARHTEKGLAGGVQQALANQQQIGGGGPQRTQNSDNSLSFEIIRPIVRIFL